MTLTSNLKLWLECLIYEKGIDKGYMLEVEDGFFTHYISINTILDLITKTCAEEKERIYNNFVAIDFMNGDIMEYFQHLATAYITA